MDQNSRYFKQVKLLVQVLPAITNYDCLALKGGTAINLFVRNLPRLSVDIDLTYVPVNQRDVALSEIHEAFSGLRNDMESLLPGVHVTGSVLTGTNYLYKLVVQLERKGFRGQYTYLSRLVFLIGILSPFSLMD